jgi:hypothetical protein
VFFALAFLLTTVYSDVWRPLLITCAAAIVVGVCEPFLLSPPYYGVFGAMSGELYFRTGQWPWPGLAAGVATTAALVYGASIHVRNRDF